MLEDRISDADRPVRLIVRHLGEYNMQTGGRWMAFTATDPLDGVLVRTVLGVNLAAKPYDDGDGWHGVDAAGPWRPVSVSALAQSLGLRFETVRGRVKALADAGLLVRERDGLVASDCLARRAGFAAFVAAEADAVRAVTAAIVADAYDADGPVARGAEALGRLPDALAARLALELDMRCIEGFVALYGGFRAAVIQAMLVAMNVRPVLSDAALSRTYAAHGRPPPDELRAPVTARALAREAGMAFETVRRMLNGLERQGNVARRGDGWIVPAARLTGDVFARNNDRLVQSVLRMLNTAARLAAPPSR